MGIVYIRYLYGGGDSSDHAAITTADRTETSGRTTVHEPFGSTLFFETRGRAGGGGGGTTPVVGVAPVPCTTQPNSCCRRTERVGPPPLQPRFTTLCLP